MQNVYELVKHFLINSRNRLRVIIDVTLHVIMTFQTVADRLLIKTSQTGKAWIVEKVIVEFPVRR